MENNDFESRLEAAKKILEKLMDPELTLAESVKAYEEGIRALQEAQKLLEDAQAQVAVLRGSKEA